MPIFDNDGVGTYEIGKVWDDDGTAVHQIGKVWDDDGASVHLVYSADLSLFPTQDASISLISAGDTNPQYTYANNDTGHIYLGASSEAGGGYDRGAQSFVRSTTKIDLTEYSTLTFVADLIELPYYGTHGSSRFGITDREVPPCYNNNGTFWYEGWIRYTGAEQGDHPQTSGTFTINIADITGAYYVFAGVCAGLHNTRMWINKIILE